MAVEVDAAVPKLNGVGPPPPKGKGLPTAGGAEPVWVGPSNEGFPKVNSDWPPDADAVVVAVGVTMLVTAKPAKDPVVAVGLPDWLNVKAP